MSTFLAACVQLRSTDDVEANLRAVEALVARAARAGASLVVTPENTPYLGPPAGKLRSAEPAGGPTEQRLAALAAHHGVHLLVGSLGERLAAPTDAPPTTAATRCHNTSLLYGPDGAELARYRKIHLFDVDIPDGPRFAESAHIAPGDTPVVAETALGRVGLTVCYDMRFPELYRALVDRGAELITVPSAFTVPTGKDHWHPLLRARAIETQAYVFAAAQEGRHDPAGARWSYGHSLIVDPWGVVLADCGEGPGLALAEVDLDRVRQVRASMPVQRHRRL
jgi:predicted amidohydrolase